MNNNDILRALKRKQTTQLLKIKEFIEDIIESREDNNHDIRNECLICGIVKPHYQMVDSECCKRCHNKQDI